LTEHVAVLGEDAIVTYEIDGGCRASRDCPGYPAHVVIYSVEYEDGRDIDGDDLAPEEREGIEAALLERENDRRMDRW
jgi:hypothetical protein